MLKVWPDVSLDDASEKFTALTATSLAAWQEAGVKVYEGLFKPNMVAWIPPACFLAERVGQGPLCYGMYKSVYTKAKPALEDVKAVITMQRDGKHGSMKQILELCHP